MDGIWRGGVGFNKTAVMSELDSWPHGLALCKGQLRPCRLRLSELGSCREFHAFAQFSATKCSIPHHSATHALGPLLSHDPPVSLPHASDSARSPEGKSGTRQGRRCIETTRCLTSNPPSSAVSHIKACDCAHLAVGQFRGVRCREMNFFPASN